LVSASRRAPVADSWVTAAVSAISDGGRAGTVTTRVALPNGTRATLECDLSFEGYRRVALRPDALARDPELRLFVSLARHADLVLDAGANAGLFAFAAAASRPDARVIAIEPIPRLASLIRANASLNGWSDRVAVREALVGDSCGTGRLFVLQSDTESTVDPRRAAAQVVRAIVDAPMVRLDEVVWSAVAEPAATLIKIDVEGHERAALGGLSGLIRTATGRPELFIEFLGAAIGDGLIEQTVAFGYSIYYVSTDRLIQVRSGAEFLAYQDLNCWNFLCSTRPHPEIVRDAEQAGITCKVA
jgi:FkbM family methyltransferase